MAGKNINRRLNLKDSLLQKSHSFSFFQAVRLLNRYSIEKNPSIPGSEQKPYVTVTTERSAERDFFKNITVKPNLSLAFPKSEIEKIEINEKTGKFDMTVNFLTMYGTLSPLPTFYTEDLFEEQRADESFIKDFLDIVNSRFYELLFSIWSKYRSMIQVTERHQTSHMERLFCIGGFGEKQIRDKLNDSFGLLRYVSLFSMPSRSRVGLRILLSDYLGHKVDVEHFIERIVQIPESQRCSLGSMNCTLGTDGAIGSEVQDRMGTFKVIVSPLSCDEYREFYPGRERSKKLMELIKLYVSAPLLFTVDVHLKREEARVAVLGNDNGDWGALGLDTWAFNQEKPEETKMTLYS